MPEHYFDRPLPTWVALHSQKNRQPKRG